MRLYPDIHEIAARGSRSYADMKADRDRLAAELDACRADRLELSRRLDQFENNRDILAARVVALREALTGLMDEVRGLVAESEGVYGLHMNGDGAPWDELLPGGQFERLGSLDVAARVLQGADA